MYLHKMLCCTRRLHLKNPNLVKKKLQMRNARNLSVDKTTTYRMMLSCGWRQYPRRTQVVRPPPARPGSRREPLANQSAS
jgi:hypothetical protein